MDSNRCKVERSPFGKEKIMQKQALFCSVFFALLLFPVFPCICVSQEEQEGWFTMDVADSGLAGSAEITAVSDTMYDMTILASGHDIWDSADDFHFVWREYPADGTVVIEGRLHDFQRATNDWAKAGIMFRTNTTQGSPYVFAIISAAASGGQSGRCMQWRDTQDTAAAWDTVHPQQAVPVWIRAVYIEGTMSVYFAEDIDDEPGQWMLHGSHALAVGNAEIVNGGFAVSSHDDAAYIEAGFSHIKAAEIELPSIEEFTAVDNAGGTVELNWTTGGTGTFNTATIERFVVPADTGWTEIASLDETAISFSDTTDNLTIGNYRLTVSLDAEPFSGSIVHTVTTKYLSSEPGAFLSEILADAPSAFWRLDDKKGALSALNWGSLWTAAEGTYRGTITLQTPSLVEGDGASYGFNGRDSALHIPDAVEFNSGGPYQAKTVELWFITPSIGTAPEILFEQGGTTRGLNMYVSQQEGAPFLYMAAWNQNDDEGFWGPVSVKIPVEEHTLYHAVMVFEASDNDLYGDFDGRVSGYLNGAFIDEAFGADLLYIHGDDIGIGGIVQNTRFHDNTTAPRGHHFTGLIDEICYYTYALDDPAGIGERDETRIEAHYTAGKKETLAAAVTNAPPSDIFFKGQGAYTLDLGCVGIPRPELSLEIQNGAGSIDENGLVTCTPAEGVTSFTLTANATNTGGSFQTQWDVSILSKGYFYEVYWIDRPLGYWRFDEAQGEVVAVNKGSLEADIDGAYNGGIQLETPGLPGTDDNTAALFNGTDTSVTIPDNDNINITNGPFHTISIELWFQADLIDATPRILYEQGGSTRGLSIYVVRELDEPYLYMTGWNLAEQLWGPIAVGTSIEEGVPYYAVMVFAATTENDLFGDFDGRITGYLNGELFDEVIGADQLYNHSDDIAFGNVAGSTLDKSGLGITGVFSGIIDEAAWYDYLLDDPDADGDPADSRVAVHYEAGTQSGVNRFIGDANCDGGVNIADAVSVLTYYFAGGTACCLTNMDANGDGGVNIADAVTILTYYFTEGQLTDPAGAVIETPGCYPYNQSLVDPDVLPCDQPCE